MKKHSITYFVLRTLIAALPVFLLMATYAILDPFKVIHRQDELPQPGDSITLGENAGYQSITCLNRNIKAGRTYDSFILGSSMSQAYKTSSWKQYLPPEASVFHLDASEETIQGMVDKLNYLERMGIKASNALIIIEEAMLHRVPVNDNFLFIRPSCITTDVNCLQFHLQFFNLYKNPTFIKYSLWPDKFKDEMIHKRYATTILQTHTDSTNENLFTAIDSIIAGNPADYYTARRIRANYYCPPPAPEAPGITPDIERSLAQLAQCLKRHHTNYIVIVPPRFNRQLLHPYDRGTLDFYLGADRVHDLSRHHYSTLPQAYYDWAAHLTTTRCDTLLMQAYAGME